MTGEANREAFRLARDALVVHPEHHLELGRRALVWRTLGPPQSGSARKMRRALAARTLSHISNHAGAGQEAEVVRRATEAITIHSASPGDLQALAGDLQAECDDILYETSGERVPSAGLCAVRAVAVYAWDFFPEYPVDARDDQFDPTHWDCAFFAAAALAKGPPWVATADITRRRVFWEWWLELAETIDP